MGKRPTAPPTSAARRKRDTLKRTLSEFSADNLTDWAAALTYYAVLALFPALIALVSIIGLVGPAATDPLLENIGKVAPGPAKEVLTGAIEGLASSGGGAGIAFVIGLVLALNSASGYIAAFSRASNAIYEVEEGRPIWKLKPAQIATALVLVLLLAVVAIAVTFTGPLAKEAGKLIGVGDSAVKVWDFAKIPVIMLVVAFMLAFLYLGDAQRQAARLQIHQPRRHRRSGHLDPRVAAIHLLRGELRLLQQDLRIARRRHRVPDVAVDHQHRDSLRR